MVHSDNIFLSPGLQRRQNNFFSTLNIPGSGLDKEFWYVSFILTTFQRIDRLTDRQTDPQTDRPPVQPTADRLTDHHTNIPTFVIIEAPLLELENSTVPVNKESLTGTVPVNNLFLKFKERMTYIDTF